MRRFFIFLSVLGVILFIVPSFLSTYTPLKQLQLLPDKWTFYEDAFIDEYEGKQGVRVEVPGSFRKHMKDGDSSGYGTYVLKWQVPENFQNKTLQIIVPFEYTAYALYADRQIIARAGRVGDEKTHVTHLEATAGAFMPTSDEVEIALEVSSYDSYRGGMAKELYIGEFDASTKYGNILFFNTSFMVGWVLSIGLMGIIMAIFIANYQRFLVFGFFCMSYAFRIVFAEPFLYTKLTFIPWNYAIRAEYFFTIICMMTFIWLMKLYYEKYISNKVVFYSIGVGFVMIIAVLFTKPVIFQTLYYSLTWVVIPLACYLIYIMYQSRHINSILLRLNVVGFAILCFGVLLDFLSGAGIIYMRFDLTTMTFSFYLFLQLLAMSKEFAESQQELRELNATLDYRIEKRTEQLLESVQQLKEIAWWDHLTGIHNRHYFNMRSVQTFSNAYVQQKPFALCMLDIDEFKKYNDYYGHLAGDQLLTKFAKLIKEALPEEALYARFGGEEFVVALPDYDMEAARALAEHLRLTVEQAQFEHLGRTCGIVTVSIGVSHLTTEKSVDELLKVADYKLYEAKERGRNCVIS